MEVLATACYMEIITECYMYLLYNIINNKPTCARVAAMTSVAQIKINSAFFNAKVNFTIMLHYVIQPWSEK